MYNIEYTDLFLSDLDWIVNYVWKDNIWKIQKQIDFILDLLLINPEMWKKIEFWDREIIVPKYKYQIRYELSWKTISLLMIYKFKNR